MKQRFFDISRAFDKVWHEGVVNYAKSHYVSISFGSFLTNRKQSVVLNGHNSSWADMKAGIPRGSILGSLFFLLYINDVTEH